MIEYGLTLYLKPGRPVKVLVYENAADAIRIGRVYARIHQFLWRVTNGDGIALAWSKELYMNQGNEK